MWVLKRINFLNANSNLMFLQPFAWEAREFVRKKLIGKEVLFTVEYKPPGSTREYGCVFLNKGKTKCQVIKIDYPKLPHVEIGQKTDSTE